MNAIDTISLINNTTSLQNLTASELSHLLNTLTAQESSPGGPYLMSSSIEENVTLNLKIYELFAAQHKYLPNTLAYVNASSELLTSVLKVKLIKLTNVENITKNNNMPLRLSEEIRKSITNSATLPELRNHIDVLGQKIHKIDKNGEITQLARLFAKSLKLPIKIPNITFDRLGTANFLTWMTYTLYDSIIDNQKPNQLDLMAATTLNRIALDMYRDAGLDINLLNKSFLDVDQANAQEVIYCRTETNQQQIVLGRIPSKDLLTRLLASRSSVHYLGPYSILKKYCKPASLNKDCLAALNGYCASRQYNDDIHDWEDDLRNGRLTYSVSRLIKAGNIQPGSYSFNDIIPKLRQIFWDYELEEQLNECLQIARKSQQGYVSALKLKPDSVFEKATLVPIIDSLEVAIKQHQFDKEFLKIARF